MTPARLAPIVVAPLADERGGQSRLDDIIDGNPLAAPPRRVMAAAAFRKCSPGSVTGSPTGSPNRVIPGALRDHPLEEPFRGTRAHAEVRGRKERDLRSIQSEAYR